MKNDKMKQQYRINEQIRVREVRIVGDDGSIVVPTRQALDMARDQEVDLVEIWSRFRPMPILPYVVSSTTPSSYTSRRSARRR